MMMRNLLSLNERKILRKLSTEYQGMTRYLVGKELDLRSSSVKFLIDTLEQRNLVSTRREEVWKTGKTRKEFVLTFVGWIYYLNSLPRGYNSPHIRRHIKKYGDILDYPIFSEFDHIDTALNQRGLRAFLDVSNSLLREPPDCFWNKMTFKYRHAKIFLSKKSDRNDARSHLKEAQEGLWRVQFSYLLWTFYLQGHLKQLSLKLSKYYNGILEDKIKRLEQELSKTKKQRDVLRVTIDLA